MSYGIQVYESRWEGKVPDEGSGKMGGGRNGLKWTARDL